MTFFSSGDDDQGHDIPLIPGAKPIRQPLGPGKEKKVGRQLEDLPQKDCSWRFCADYSLLNGVTQQDAYPFPRIDKSLEALSGSRYFNTLDFLSGYWQFPLSEDAQDKAALIMWKVWKWKVLPFGLTRPLSRG